LYAKLQQLADHNNKCNVEKQKLRPKLQELHRLLYGVPNDSTEHGLKQRLAALETSALWDDQAVVDDMCIAQVRALSNILLDAEQSARKCQQARVQDRNDQSVARQQQQQLTQDIQEMVRVLCEQEAKACDTRAAAAMLLIPQLTVKQEQTKRKLERYAESAKLVQRLQQMNDEELKSKSDWLRDEDIKTAMLRHEKTKEQKLVLEQEIKELQRQIQQFNVEHWRLKKQVYQIAKEDMPELLTTIQSTDLLQGILCLCCSAEFFVFYEC